MNQVAYAFSKGVIMAPFRELLKPDNKFSWTEELDRSFIAAKQEIVRLVEDGVKMFDPDLVTCMSTDRAWLDPPAENMQMPGDLPSML